MMRCRLLMGACLLALCAPAIAAQRTFVSSTGLDTNDCALTRPCRQFATAIANTDANGEIVVLDSAGYGAVAIDKSISIVAPQGVYAGVTVFSGAGVTVHPGAGGKVVLRGLTINGQGGLNGIAIQSGDEIHVEQCVVSNVAATGIDVAGSYVAVHISETVVRSAGSALSVHAIGARVFVSDSSFAQSAGDGIGLQAGELSLDRVRVEESGVFGLRVAPASLQTVRASVRDSLFSANQQAIFVIATTGSAAAIVSVERSAALLSLQAGIVAQGGAGNSIELTVSHSVVSDSAGQGLYAIGGAVKAFVGGSTLTRNSVGLHQSAGATLYTYSNNALVGNTTATSGTITPLSLQ